MRMKCRHGRVVTTLACLEATIVKHPDLQQDLQAPKKTNSQKAWEVFKFTLGLLIVHEKTNKNQSESCRKLQV